MMRRGLRSTCSAVATVPLFAAEPFLLERGRGGPKCSVFLVGAPRSGTTLAYQLISHCFQMSYFTNIADFYWRSPTAASFIVQRAIRAYSSDFASRGGHARGLAAPSQGDRIWSRWFGPDRERVCPDDLRDDHVSQARATVGAVAAVVGGPFVNKSIGNSVRIPALARVFPNSLFVHVKRNLALTAQSHYLNYLNQRLPDGSVKRWTSARPPEYEHLLDLPLVAKATAQVYYIDKCVENDLRELENTMTVHYERICADPGTLVEQIFAHKAMSALSVRRREPPAGFTESRSIKVERRVFRRIESTLGELQIKSG
jgi:hypothetical protein